MIMPFETDVEILYIPIGMPTEVQIYDDSYETQYEINCEILINCLFMYHMKEEEEEENETMNVALQYKMIILH